MKKFSTPETAFSILKAITVLIAAAVIAMTCGLLYTGVYALRRGAASLHLSQGSFVTLAAAGFTSVIVVAVCCGVALYTFFRMCTRLSQGTAFTQANALAMARITRCCMIAGCTLGLACAALLIAEAVWGGVMGLYWSEAAVIAFAFLSVGAVAWALTLLVRRAVLLQEEADLTV